MGKDLKLLNKILNKIILIFQKYWLIILFILFIFIIYEMAIHPKPKQQPNKGKYEIEIKGKR
jgi:type II secretory pathway component PulF